MSARDWTNEAAIQRWATFPREVLAAMEPDGDFCRRHLLNPALLRMLGNVRGQRILDAGCGHGYLSRMLAARGAQVTGVERLGCHLRETAEPALDPVAAAAADPAAGAYVHLPNFLVVAARRP